MSRWRVLPYGPGAALVEVADAEEAARLAAWLRSGSWGAVDVVAAARTVLVDGVDADRVRALLPQELPERAAAEAAHVRVPVRYDGPDLGLVARAWGCDEDEVVRIHTTTEFTAAFSGFAPGFAYLTGLPESRGVRRLESPRPRVPAGSVALAGHWCGIYPTASPGGWLLLGVTELPLWDAARAEPALIPPGTTVTFEALG